MTTAGANPTGQKQDDIRTLFFGQDSVNPNFNGQNNPTGNIITSYFPGVQQFARARLSLTNLNLYNSWYNITAARNNNTFQYVYPEGSAFVPHTVVLPDGSFETVDEINDHLQLALLANGDYLIHYNDETGESTIDTFISIAASTYAYAYTITLNQLPAVITTRSPVDGDGSGWFAPAAGYVTPVASVVNASDENFTPQFIILATSAGAGTTNTNGTTSFSKVMGIVPGTYGTNIISSGQVVVTSTFAPQIQYTSVVYVACNLVNMGDTNRNPNVFFQFVPNAPFGELVIVVPPYPVFVPVADSFYSYIQITLFDENFNPLQMQDPQVYGAVIVQG